MKEEQAGVAQGFSDVFSVLLTLSPLKSMVKLPLTSPGLNWACAVSAFENLYPCVIGLHGIIMSGTCVMSLTEKLQNHGLSLMVFSISATCQELAN